MTKGGVPGPIDIESEQDTLLSILREVRDTPDEQWDLAAVLRRYPRDEGTYAKSQLLAAYRVLSRRALIGQNERIENRLRGRPVRTVSGVAPVAVLTEQYACPGACIFCPTQDGAPKSYLNGEPGVLRAIQNCYDPYAQTASRLEALSAIGHPVDKVELLVLGGTWSAYPTDYREYFLRRCFDAMNQAVSPSLGHALSANASAPHRNVGLVVETRPDWITPVEVLNLRREGVTKVQVGAQSLDDDILYRNGRGHSVADTRRAVELLRLAGFKIVLHWMPNLYGATPESDRRDFARLWDDPSLRPDELKIYPTVLLHDTGLYQLWQQGKYQPYAEEALVELLVACKQLVPAYCRINRIMRDIPADYVVEGTTKSNLRQVVHSRMLKQGVSCRCIRCREVRETDELNAEEIQLDMLRYDAAVAQEVLLQYVRPDGRLLAFLRLSLPKEPRIELGIDEIRYAAMVRELHVYGPAQLLGHRDSGVQHRGLGSQLLERAAQLAQAEGYHELSVIAAAGTVDYYRRRGFTEGVLYPKRVL